MNQIDDRKEIENFENQLVIYEKNCFLVKTPQDYEKVAVTLKQTKQLLKIVEDKEKEVTKPLNEGLKKARDLFRPIKDKLNIVINSINLNMTQFRKEQEEEAKKQQEIMNKQATEDDLFIPEIKAEIPKTEIRIRKNYRYKIVDITKINPQFMIPDERKIGEVVRAMKEKAVEIIGKGSIEIIIEETNY